MIYLVFLSGNSPIYRFNLVEWGWPGRTEDELKDYTLLIGNKTLYQLKLRYIIIIRTRSKRISCQIQPVKCMKCKKCMDK